MPHGQPDTLHLQTKLEIARRVVGAISWPDFVKKTVANSEDNAVSALEDAASSNIPKWLQGKRPTSQSSLAVWDQFARVLGCDQRVMGADLVNLTSIATYVGLFGTEQQARACNLCAELSNGQLAIPDVANQDSTAPSIRLDPSFTPEAIEEAIENRRFDISHYYGDEQAAREWLTLLRSPEYKLYDECSSGLMALIASREWKQTIMPSQPRTIVALAGGGSPTKDWLLIDRFLSAAYMQERTLHYVLIDSSLHMLRASGTWLATKLEKVPAVHERVDIQLLDGDILALGGVRQKLGKMRIDGPILFAILGGSIGNLNENSFFASLDGVVQAGDFLLVGAETIDGPPSKAVKTTMVKRYDTEALRKFVRPVVSAVLYNIDHGSSVRNALERIDIKFKSASEVGSSEVAGSWSVVANLPVKRRDLTLFTSTRYVPDALIAFAKVHKWVYKAGASSHLNRNYRQFLFRKE